MFSVISLSLIGGMGVLTFCREAVSVLYSPQPAGKENSWIHTFSKVLALCEMQTALSRFQIWVAMCISFNSNHYSRRASILYLNIVKRHHCNNEQNWEEWVTLDVSFCILMSAFVVSSTPKFFILKLTTWGNLEWSLKENRLEKLEIRWRIETIETTALLRFPRILSEVLETWGYLLSFRFQWKTTS